MSKKKKIILLHGWGANVEKFKPLRNSLKKTGWEVVIPKLPGFDAKQPDTSWMLDDYVYYLEKTLNKKMTDSDYIIFGHSFGGRMAIKMALKNTKTKGVILCATSGLSRGNPVKRVVFGTAAKLGKVFLFNHKAAKVFKKLLYKAAREHDYEKTSGVMKETFRNIIAEDLKPLVGKITIPALVLWGEDDKMTPVSDAFFLKKNIKKSSLVVYKNEGHRLPYSKPEKIAREIDLWYQNL